MSRKRTLSPCPLVQFVLMSSVTRRRLLVLLPTVFNLVEASIWKPNNWGQERSKPGRPEPATLYQTFPPSPVRTTETLRARIGLVSHLRTHRQIQPPQSLDDWGGSHHPPPSRPHVRAHKYFKKRSALFIRSEVRRRLFPPVYLSPLALPPPPAPPFFIFIFTPSIYCVMLLSSRPFLDHVSLVSFSIRQHPSIKLT